MREMIRFASTFSQTSKQALTNTQHARNRTDMKTKVQNSNYDIIIIITIYNQNHNDNGYNNNNNDNNHSTRDLASVLIFKQSKWTCCYNFHSYDPKNT